MIGVSFVDDCIYFLHCLVKGVPRITKRFVEWKAYEIFDKASAHDAAQLSHVTKLGAFNIQT